MKFSWNEARNLANKRKHNVRFEEAQDLFGSGDYLEIFDAEHSEIEERFIAIGPIGRGPIVVVWTEAEADEIRIVSARMATKVERDNCGSYTEEYRSHMEEWK